jgi:two-component system cell cycle response regulator DivK
MARILLVEDNEMNPDLILMDMSLPVLDGWEATRRLKAAPETRSIPVLALTAHAMSGDHDKAIEAGCDDFDTKPVEFDRLLTKIEALLNMAAASLLSAQRAPP